MAGDGTTTYVSFQSDSLPYSCSPHMALRSDKSTLGSETGRYDSHHHHLTYHTLIVRTDGLLSTCQHHYPQTTTLEDVGVVRRHAMFGLAQCTEPSIAGEVKSKVQQGRVGRQMFHRFEAQRLLQGISTRSTSGHDWEYPA